TSSCFFLFSKGLSLNFAEFLSWDWKACLEGSYKVSLMVWGLMIASVDSNRQQFLLSDFSLMLFTRTQRLSKAVAPYLEAKSSRAGAVSAVTLLQSCRSQASLSSSTMNLSATINNSTAFSAFTNPSASTPESPE